MGFIVLSLFDKIYCDFLGIDAGLNNLVNDLLQVISTLGSVKIN